MRTWILAATVSAALSTTAAFGETYPAKPITIVVPFAAGGPVDVMARTLAGPMSATLGVPILIENVPGAAGTVGVGRVAAATPDGYTVSIGHWSTHVLNGAIYPLRFDLINDLSPVVMLPSAPQLIVARVSLPVGSLAELVSWLKSNSANVGTAGVGSAIHVAGLLFKQRTDTDFVFVSYRSGGQALQDLIAGHVDFSFDQASNSLPYVRSKQLKALAVTSNARLAAAPEIPTVDEAGLPGFYISVWYGLWVPKGTPADVVTKLNTAAVQAMSDPAISKRLSDLGQTLPARDQLTPQALGALQKAEADRWWPIVKAANIKPE
jgi:tripartite-type tricarboxylate transporter receptor subunit TctC